MKMPKIGDEMLIHSYKHNGKIHRSWETGYVLDSNEERSILINEHTRVNESDGRVWYTREPAIVYLSHKDWYNVICMIRKNGVFYYCNIASPTLYDGEAYKYIDYDLDLKVFPNEGYKVLDVEEYRIHAKEMQYSEDIDLIVHKQLDELIEMAGRKEGVFDPEFASYWYGIYLTERKSST